MIWPLSTSPFLHALHPCVVEGYGAALLVDLVIALIEPGDQAVDGLIEVGLVLRRPRDDEGRAGLVDEDRIDFIDDGVVEGALDHGFELELHVVAQVVETELVVGAVGHVGDVGGTALIVRKAMHDAADLDAQEPVDLAHPLGIAARQIIVHGDDVNALALERVQVNRQRRGQRLSLARLHLGDAAFVQDDAADQLGVEMALAQGAFRGLAHGGESLDEKVVEFLAVA